MNFNPVGIVSALRLPIGKINGVYRNVLPEELYQNLINQQFQKVGIKKEKIEKVILGNVTNQGGNLARRCALKAGLKNAIAMTLDCQCGSGLASLIMAANAIKSLDERLICCGGVESTSNANITLDKDTKQPIKRFRMAPSGFEDFDMGIIADFTARKFNISRMEQDKYALNSHLNAIRAIESKKILDELVPYKADMFSVIRDQTVRFNSSLSALNKLKAVFEKEGSVTAGNSCPINDGAASIVLANLKIFKQFQGYYLGQCSITLEPKDFLLGPIFATEKLLKKYSLDLSKIEVIELNEAFAVQSILFKKHFNVTDSKLNSFGGALAYGHPYGATGGILVARTLNRLNRISKPSLGIVTLCVAGGMGISILIANKWWKNEINN